MCDHLGLADRQTQRLPHILPAALPDADLTTGQDARYGTLNVHIWRYLNRRYQSCSLHLAQAPLRRALLSSNKNRQIVVKMEAKYCVTMTVLWCHPRDYGGMAMPAAV